MVIIDCLGDVCPVPIIKANKTIASMNSGQSVKIITDHSCVSQSMIDYFKKSRYRIEAEEVMNGVWEIIITIP